MIRLGGHGAFVPAVSGLPMPVTFGEAFPPDHFPIWSYRYPRAPDLKVRQDGLPVEPIPPASGYRPSGRACPPRRAACAVARRAGVAASGEFPGELGKYSGTGLYSPAA